MAHDLEGMVSHILEEMHALQGAMLPILHAIQDSIGYVPEEAVPLVAKGLNVSRAEVHGVLTFYRHFRRTPPGKHVLQICCAESCQAMGANRLAEHAKKALGCDFHELSRDGLFSLEPVYCLGQCATSPAVMIDGEVHARMNPEKLDRLLEGTES